MFKPFSILLLSFLFSCQMPLEKVSDKIVIAHRGASGYLPEHTMESKAMAYGMNAHFIEQDLVLSKDGIPIVIHDIYLDEVTNVQELFPDMSRSDGRYYVIDFTYEQIKTLSVFERFDHKTKKPVFPDRFPYNQSTFKLHRFQDEIEMIQGLNKSSGKTIGIYPEIKAPSFHRNEGKDISKIVLQILSDYGYTDQEDLCILQCFDPTELQRIRKDLSSELFLTQLMEFPAGAEDLDNYAVYANAIGPSIQQLILAGTGKKEGNKIVDKAHELGLKVHAYTFRKDEHPNFESYEDLLQFGFYDINLDGGFTDFPDITVQYLKESPQ
ncbi:glycerophosphodiester phosphodiesterase [Lutimonas sp.]|uniref:glycerophosphodiester phosphodiesterase n=1 Tax=Lutimonas sp. TaxID=1872403 RepID=UPI003D9BBDDB